MKTAAATAAGDRASSTPTKAAAEIAESASMISSCRDPLYPKEIASRPARRPSQNIAGAKAPAQAETPSTFTTYSDDHEETPISVPT